ncbi:hypothetical protein OESDEN_15577 [Oesophagostomum dentatum]|uniref:Uncharacterized protein n=1 Tax=Oesophagostomum dentatum TaxID=61180 RepID=A0A0B1SLF4_OESDE|nr:hypothetical protein OESDEN_15577 [Oesophagostomum dentatum]
MITNGSNKLVSFYHFMGNANGTVGHFFYKRWPLQRALSREFKQLARQCIIKRPVASSTASGSE